MSGPTTPNRTPIVAWYLRVAAAGDDAEQQLEQQRALCRMAGEINELGRATEFVDLGVSGLTAKRRGLQRLLRMARRGQISHVIVADPARLARLTLLWVQLVQELRSNDVSVLVAADREDDFEGVHAQLTEIATYLAERRTA